MSTELDKTKVLVVDDKPYMRTLVRAILGGFKLRRVEEANDGSEGFEEYRQFQPDIVITDWNMQPISGRKFVRSIREFIG